VKKAYLYIAISTLMFSSMEIALKMAGSAFNPNPIESNSIFYWGNCVTAICIAGIKANRTKVSECWLAAICFNRASVCHCQYVALPTRDYGRPSFDCGRII
jgi:hypothetical protein